MRMISKILGLSVLLSAACGGVLAQSTNASGAPVWHGDAAFGLSLARGNANTFLMNASATAENVWEQNDLKLGADGQYALNDFGQTNETRAAESVHGFTDYKRLITERFYGDVRLDLSHDDVAEVRYRAILGPAIGYYFIKSDASKLNLDVGVSYLRQRLDDSGNTGYATLHVGEHGEHAFNKSAKVWEDVQYFPQITRFSNYLLDCEVGAEAALNAHFSLRIVVDDHFNSEPAASRDRKSTRLNSSH